MNIKKIGLVALFLFGAGNSYANTAIVELDGVYTYDDYAGGVVVLMASNDVEGCEKGGYMKPDALGFDAMYGLGLSAYMARHKVALQFYATRFLNGNTSSGICELDAVRVHVDW